MTLRWNFRSLLQKLLKGEPLTPEELDEIYPLVLQAEVEGVDIAALKAVREAIRTVPRTCKINLFEPEFYQSRREFARTEMAAASLSLQNLAQALMSHFHLDPRRFASDGQLLVPGLHDGTLKSLEISEGGGAILETRNPEKNRIIRLTFADESAACVWTGGAFVPLIIARVLGMARPFDREKMQIPGETLDALLVKANEFASDWILYVDPALGDPVAVLGRGELAAAMTIDICSDRPGH